MIQVAKIIILGLLSTHSPPKAHGFIKPQHEKKSSMSYGVISASVALSLFSLITTFSLYLDNSCLLLEMLYRTGALTVDFLKSNIELAMRDMIQIKGQLSIDCIQGMNYLSAQELHNILTPIIKNLLRLLHFLENYIIKEGGSAVLQELLTRLADLCSSSLFQYRLIESVIGITLANSPISI